ncbi:unnamed protein product [Symbiodinium microadriaticum]|nr:unnamed protein product [Symbiodinium microadriaticum]
MTLPCSASRRQRPMWQPSAVSSGILEEDATTIMLRSLPASTSLRSLLHMLEPLGRAVYDFVYLPRCTRQRHRIVELAFLNFVDPAVARAAVQIFFRHAHSEPSWGRTRISQARLQGLPNNLAYYCLRFGPDAPLDGPDAPVVFSFGGRVPLQLAVQRLVTEEALRTAQQLLDTEGRGREEGPSTGDMDWSRARDERHGTPMMPSGPPPNSSIPMPGFRRIMPSITSEVFFVGDVGMDDTDHLLRLVREHERRQAIAFKAWP